MSAGAWAAYRSRIAGRTSPTRSRKSPEIKPFCGHRSTYSRQAHCIKDRVLLEVPVGTGVLTMPVYKKLPDAEIVCLDYSPEMMKNAERRASSMEIRNVLFRRGDVSALPFEDGSFDIVLSLNGFHAFPDKEAAYSETFRVLKKGGTFCGCFYIQGEKKRTDWFCKHVLTPKGSFTPPYETKQSLKIRLSQLYEDVELKNINAVGIFCCKK